MSISRLTIAVAVLAAIVVTGWLWYSPASPLRSADSATGASTNNGGGTGGGDGADSVTSDTADASDSPFSVGAAGAMISTGTVTATDALSEDSVQSGSPEQAAVVRLPVDVSQVGRAPLGDDEFESLVARLSSDATLLQQLIDEFRQELDPDRRALLARLLGEVGGADVTQVASELIYSGDDQARSLGLDLLQQVQPGNAEARDIASGLLATEVEPDVLVDTLTSLASAGVVDDTSRAFLADQIALLANHDDPGVRGISLDILSRWSTDGRDTPVLLNGLADSEQRVRESAAYALVNHENDSQPVIDSLWQVAQDDGETEATRRAAILALRSLTLTDQQRDELMLTERRLDTVRR